MATIPVLLPGESPWTEEPGGLSPWGCKELDTTKRLGTQHTLRFHSLVFFLMRSDTEARRKQTTAVFGENWINRKQEYSEDIFSRVAVAKALVHTKIFLLLLNLEKDSPHSHFH